MDLFCLMIMCKKFYVDYYYMVYLRKKINERIKKLIVNEYENKFIFIKFFLY